MKMKLFNSVIDHLFDYNSAGIAQEFRTCP